MKYPESERVKILRNNETFREFSERFETSGSNIAAIEADKQGLSVQLARKIAAHYNVSLDWLYGITEDGGIGENAGKNIKRVRDYLVHGATIPPNSELAEYLEAITVMLYHKHFSKIIEEKDQRIALLERYIEDQKGLIDLYKGLAEKKQP